MQVAAIGLRGFPNVIGGIETQCEQIYTTMQRQFRDIEMHVFVRSAYVPFGTHTYQGLRIHRLWAPHLPGLEAFLHSLFAILHARLILGIRRLHIHGIGPAFWTPLARALGMKVMVTHHAPDFERPKWRLIARLVLRMGEYFAARHAHAIICVSNSVERSFLNRHPAARDRTTVVTNAVILPEDDSAITDRIFQTFGLQANNFILAAGRLERTKRFDDLLIASKRLNGEAPRIVIAGSAADVDPYEDELKAEAGPNVVLTGFCTGAELAVLYRNCSLFIHPSAMEGFGLVVLEALTLGAPVTVSDIDAHREFALPEHCYFKVGDIDAIARAMRPANHDRYIVPDRAGIVARYALDRSVAAYEQVLRAL